MGQINNWVLRGNQPSAPPASLGRLLDEVNLREKKGAPVYGTSKSMHYLGGGQAYDTSNNKYYRAIGYDASPGGSLFKKIAKIGLTAGASMINPAFGAAVGAGMGAMDGGGLKGAIMGGVGGYAAGGLGNAIKSGVGAYGAAQGLPAFSNGIAWDSALTTGLKAAGGSIASGMSGAGSMFDKLSQVNQIASALGVGKSGDMSGRAGLGGGAGGVGGQNMFGGGKLTRPTSMQRPSALSNLEGFSGIQERSALANKGVQQGLGAEEDKYFKNLTSRRLIGGKGQVASNPNMFLPVESQYFARQGLNTDNAEELLRRIRG